MPLGSGMPNTTCVRACRVGLCWRDARLLSRYEAGAACRHLELILNHPIMNQSKAVVDLGKPSCLKASDDSGQAQPPLKGLTKQPTQLQRAGRGAYDKALQPPSLAEILFGPRMLSLG